MAYIQRERDYLAKRAREGASNEVIATEMGDRFGTKRRVEEIASERQRLKLPLENPAVAREAVLKRAYAQTSPNDIYEGIAAERPPADRKPAVLSSAQAGRPARRDMNKAANATPEVKVVAEEPKPDPIEIKINFKPSYVDTCQPGKNYIVAGIGAMECTEILQERIAGFDLELITLKGLQGDATPEIKKIQKSKFPKETIREVASLDIMEQVLQKLEYGLSDIKSTPARGKDVAGFLEEHVKSADLMDVTNMLCLVFGRSRKRAEPKDTEIKTGYKAIKLIASEYALAAGIDYKNAERMVSEAVGVVKRDVTAAPSPAERPVPPSL